jgi:hypothetical protein
MGLGRRGLSRRGGDSVIALRIVPLTWADPQSRKVLVPDESKPSERFAGEDGEGFYSVVQARVEWEEGSTKRASPEGGVSWRHWFAKQVAPSDLPLYNVAYIGSQLVGVYIEHFSSPTDADDHFEETPLLTLPDVPEEEDECEELSDETLNNIERKFHKLLAKDEPNHPWVTSYRSVIPLPGSAGGSVTLPLRYDTHDRIVPLD